MDLNVYAKTSFERNNVQQNHLSNWRMKFEKFMHVVGNGVLETLTTYKEHISCD